MGIDLELIIALLFRLIKKYQKELKIPIRYILAELLSELGEYVLQYVEEECRDLRQDD